MKTCPNPNCKRDNPSSAQFCMSCGTAFVEEENKTQQNPLRIELDEIKNEIKQLKLSFAELRDKPDNSEKETESEQLTKQIEERDETIKTLSGQIDEQKNELSNLNNQLEEEKKKKKGAKGKWGWIFVILWVVSSVFVYVFWDWYTWQKNTVEYLDNTVDELRKSNRTLEKDNNDLREKYDVLSTKYPIIITNVRFERIEDTTNREKRPENTKRQNTTKKVLRISYEGFVDAEVNLQYIWYRNGDYYNSFSGTLPVKTGNHYYDLYRREAIMDNWPYGDYRLEIWCNQVELASKSFYR